jgi:N-acetyl-gamma-glutamyl-phosphate reductase
MHTCAILGPTGYTGLELIETLLAHPTLRVGYLASAREKAPRIDDEFPRLAGRLPDHVAQCRPIDHDAIAHTCKGGVAFLCLPHDAAMVHAPALLARGMKVIDLSAAYRLKDARVYAQHYGHPHTDSDGLAHAVYGLPELFRARIRAAQLVANPGCYPTGASLAVAPLLRDRLIDRQAGVIVNAASGVSGAGREPKPHTTLVEAGDNFSAYGIGTHRHQPEIAQTLGLDDGQLLFVPHLLPIERGIFETIYAAPAAGVDSARVQACLRQAYAGERFVVVRDTPPTLRDVQRTNRVHLHARVVAGRVVVLAAIDNLSKGASTQAVQNANLMLGLDEHAGLG